MLNYLKVYYHNNVMHGIILCGGSGTHLRPLTYSQQKQLIPIANKPVVCYAIDDMIKSGIKNIIIVTGNNKEQVKKVIDNYTKKLDVIISYVHQGEPKGIAHAVLMCEKEIGKNNFCLYLGDNITNDSISKHMSMKKRTSAKVLLTKVNHPERFGVAKFNSKNKLIELIEKPEIPPSNMALVGVYFFTPQIFDACKSIEPSWRNELEITHAIQYLIDNKQTVEHSEIKGWWKDTGLPQDIIDANNRILNNYKERIIGYNTKTKNSVISKHTNIGKNCCILNSCIGKNVSIGNNCTIINREITNSVILDNVTIEQGNKISDSIISALSNCTISF